MKKLICKNCYYWCWDFILANQGSDQPYDFSRSFCGLHGGIQIENPDQPISFNLLNGGINHEYPSALCGFHLKPQLIPVQLKLF